MVLLNGCDVQLGGQSWSEPDWAGLFYPRRLNATRRYGSPACAKRAERQWAQQSGG